MGTREALLAGLIGHFLWVFLEETDLGLVIGGGLLWRFAPHAPDSSGPGTSQAARPTAVPPVASDKSIAVLPFANLSDDKANAYFTAGMPLKLSEKHPDYPALTFGNYMFGGGITARSVASKYS